MLTKILVVGMGGFVGANARYWAGIWIGAHSFPWATFIINIAGCFGLAVFSTLVLDRGLFSDGTRLLVATGFFGAFTTFSTFNLEAYNLFVGGKSALAIFYLAASVGTGLIAGFVGVGLARWF